MIETYVDEWRVTAHALERFRERYGGGVSEAVLRRLLTDAEGWTRKGGDLDDRSSGARLSSPSFPGVWFVVRRHGGVDHLVTVLTARAGRRKDPRRARGARSSNPSSKRRRGRTCKSRFEPGRTSRERMERLREEDRE